MDRVSSTGRPLSPDLGHRRTEGLKRSWLIWAALGFQILTVSVVAEVHFGIAKALLVASYIVLAWALLINIRRPGIAVVLAGALLNLLAIAANGGSMPMEQKALGIDSEASSTQGEGAGYLPWSKDTLQPHEAIRLRFLSDIFPLPGPLNVVYSVGDVFILAGILIYLAGLIWRKASFSATSNDCSNSG